MKYHKNSPRLHCWESVLYPFMICGNRHVWSNLVWPHSLLLPLCWMSVMWNKMGKRWSIEWFWKKVHRRRTSSSKFKSVWIPASIQHECSISDSFPFSNRIRTLLGPTGFTMRFLQSLIRNFLIYTMVLFTNESHEWLPIWYFLIFNYAKHIVGTNAVSWVVSCVGGICSI